MLALEKTDIATCSHPKIEEELLNAAGYTANKMVIATFDKPFPLDALNPDSFERFCMDFLSKKYPEAEVHPVGGQGHTQDGVDVDVISPDNTCYVFQCKRIENFGPDKVDKVVANLKRKAKKKFILLSRVASPKSRQAVKKHTGWAIWDKEDISLYIRQLPKDDQKKLVDTFFRGQRLALLGETEPGPWQTTKEFFAPFMNVHGVFSHAWRLVGRTEDIKAIVENLSNDEIAAVLLVGTGGCGKSRVLRHVIESFSHIKKGVTVRFLSPTEEVTNKSLEILVIATNCLSWMMRMIAMICNSSFSMHRSRPTKQNCCYHFVLMVLTKSKHKQANLH